MREVVREVKKRYQEENNINNQNATICPTTKRARKWIIAKLAPVFIFVLALPVSIICSIGYGQGWGTWAYIVGSVTYTYCFGFLVWLFIVVWATKGIKGFWRRLPRETKARWWFVVASMPHLLVLLYMCNFYISLRIIIFMCGLGASIIVLTEWDVSHKEYNLDARWVLPALIVLLLAPLLQLLVPGIWKSEAPASAREFVRKWWRCEMVNWTADDFAVYKRLVRHWIGLSPKPLRHQCVPSIGALHCEVCRGSAHARHKWPF